jgi:hypothetical protein
MTAILKIIAAIFASLREQVREVNRKYAKPELEMTLLTKLCLLGLRIYLLAMIVMMVWFLIQRVKGIGHA